YRSRTQTGAGAQPDGYGAEGGAAAAASSLRDLHVGFDRHAQGSDGAAPERGAAVWRHAAVVCLWPGRCVDAVPLLCVRLFGVGSLGGLAVRGAVGGGAQADHAFAGRVFAAVGRTARDGAEPDSVGVLPAAAGGEGAAGVGAAAGTARSCIWRGGARAGAAGGGGWRGRGTL